MKINGLGKKKNSSGGKPADDRRAHRQESEEWDWNTSDATRLQVSVADLMVWREFCYLCAVNANNATQHPSAVEWLKWWTGSTGRLRTKTCSTCSLKGFSWVSVWATLSNRDWNMFLKGFSRVSVWAVLASQHNRGDADLHTIFDNQRKLSGESVSFIKIRWPCLLPKHPCHVINPVLPYLRIREKRSPELEDSLFQGDSSYGSAQADIR